MEAYAAGKRDGLTRATADVGLRGHFDFQRDGGTFIRPYTNSSNYAVGVYLAGAEYTWNVASYIASAFSHTMSSNAGSREQIEWWARGWNDATNRKGPFSTAKNRR